jgi:hypothetical protein
VHGAVERRDQRVNGHIGADRPVRAELVEDERATLAYVDRAAGIERFTEIGPDSTRRDVCGSGRGEPLPFEQPFLAGSGKEVFAFFGTGVPRYSSATGPARVWCALTNSACGNRLMILVGMPCSRISRSCRRSPRQSR